MKPTNLEQTLWPNPNKHPPPPPPQKKSKTSDKSQMRKRERKRTHRHHVATLDLIWSGRWVHDGPMVFRWMGFAIFMWMCSLTFLVSEHNPFFWFALQKKSRRSVGGFDAVSMLQKRKRSR